MNVCGYTYSHARRFYFHIHQLKYNKVHCASIQCTFISQALFSCSNINFVGALEDDRITEVVVSSNVLACL